MSDSEQKQSLTVGGGCFWCIEEMFRHLKGVDEVVSGYAGGHVPHPTYDQVCQGDTGHAEVVKVVFDPHVISVQQLLGAFFAMHDPTTPNRQGNDVGPQYRSIVLYNSPEQKAAAEQVIEQLEKDAVWDAPIVTEVAALDTFYPAEPEHERYFQRNPFQPYCRIVIAPKVKQFQRDFAHQLKSANAPAGGSET